MTSDARYSVIIWILLDAIYFLRDYIYKAARYRHRSLLFYEIIRVCLTADTRRAESDNSWQYLRRSRTHMPVSAKFTRLRREEADQSSTHNFWLLSAIMQEKRLPLARFEGGEPMTFAVYWWPRKRILLMRVILLWWILMLHTPMPLFVEHSR